MYIILLYFNDFCVVNKIEKDDTILMKINSNIRHWFVWCRIGNERQTKLIIPVCILSHCSVGMQGLAHLCIGKLDKKWQITS